MLHGKIKFNSNVYSTDVRLKCKHWCKREAFCIRIQTFYCEYHSIVCITIIIIIIVKAERLNAVPVPIQVLASTLLISSCAGPRSTVTTTSDTRWVKLAATMSTNHILEAPAGVLSRYVCNRNNEAAVHLYAHPISKASGQQFLVGREAILTSLI